MQGNKIVDIDRGKVMVVADLHGNWDDYVQVMLRWVEHLEARTADYLVFLGDLVHGRGDPGDDASVDILDDLRRKGLNDADGRIHCLLGNHEMVHIYHIELWKGNRSFTAPFEHAIAENRRQYIEMMTAMPLMARTAGGLLLVHAGACKSVGAKRLDEYGVDHDYLANWPHKALVRKAAKRAGFENGFDPLAEFDPDVGWHFSETKKGRFLWEFLMNKNERAYGRSYFDYLERFLKWASPDPDDPLNILVSGHIHAPEGANVVHSKQLRLSSGYGAESDKHKKYLLIDAKWRYKHAYELEECALPVYR